MPAKPRQIARVSWGQKIIGVLVIVAVFAGYAAVQLKAIRAARESAALERAKAAEAAKP